MKKSFTIVICLFVCVCVSRALGVGIISSNGGFEIADGPSTNAADWSQAPGVYRTNSAAHSGSWSMTIVGGIEEWANGLQTYNQDYTGMELIATAWVMSPSSDPAVTMHADWFDDCSVVFKLEVPGGSAAIDYETYAIKDQSAGGVYDTWIHITNTVASMPSSMSGFKMVCLASMSSGTVYFDDVDVVVIPEPAAIAAILGLAFLLRKKIIEQIRYTLVLIQQFSCWDFELN